MKGKKYTAVLTATAVLLSGISIDMNTKNMVSHAVEKLSIYSTSKVPR